LIERPFDSDAPVTIPRNGDLMGEVWCHVTMSSVPDDAHVFDLIDEVTYEIGGQLIEQYNGAALKMLALFDARARPTIRGNVVIFPLRLCTSANTRVYLPLICLRFHEVKIGVKIANACDATQRVLSKKLVISYIACDTNERRTRCQSPHDVHITQKHCICITQVGVPEDGKITVPLRESLPDGFGCKVRDIIVMLVPLTLSVLDKDPLESLRIVVRNPKYMHLNPAISTSGLWERQGSLDAAMSQARSRDNGMVTYIPTRKHMYIFTHLITRHLATRQAGA
jgi:hypothetical protein